MLPSLGVLQQQDETSEHLVLKLVGLMFGKAKGMWGKKENKTVLKGCEQNLSTKAMV